MSKKDSRVKICPHCKRDVYGKRGRPQTVDRVAVRYFRERGKTIREIAKLALCSVGSVENVLKEKP